MGEREEDGKINNRASCVARTKELSSNSNHPHCNYFEAASSILMESRIFYSWRSNRGRIPGQKAGFT